MPMQALALSRYTVTNALGRGRQATLDALLQRRSGLQPCDFLDANLDTYVGRVAGLGAFTVVNELADYDCRNNRLAQLALEQDGFAEAVRAARDHYGAARVAVIIGTSTSGILETELAYRHRAADGALPASFHYAQTHEMSSVAEFCRRYLEVSGPSFSISTACSSSAKVFAAAQRLIAAGMCDAAVVGGVDSLCFTTLYGFSSLELVSRHPCRPADAQRDGISIGEGAGFALLERPAAAPGAVRLLGYGESSDAHHMSTPHPEGLGAELAMRAALKRAGLPPGAIDYINLHGTATRSNDAAEDRAVSRVFGDAVACSSTKGWTGHTLGAAGITEAAISALCIEHGFVPGSLNTVTVDPAFHSRIVLEHATRPVNTVLSNSFGFGGNNCSLVFGGPAC
jgi:3-oxoacyl-[acyl-carrier-protein] synthase-1